MTTYAEKLFQWRAELRVLATALLDSDDPLEAQLVVNAIAVIKQVHDQLASLGIDESPWPVTSAVEDKV